MKDKFGNLKHSSTRMLLRAILFFASFFVSLISAESNPCSPPWVDGTSVGMGCLLFYSDYSYSFYDADEFCQGTQSAKLVSIETALHSNLTLCR